jgi:hypothetical protein
LLPFQSIQRIARAARRAGRNQNRVRLPPGVWVLRLRRIGQGTAARQSGDAASAARPITRNSRTMSLARPDGATGMSSLQPLSSAHAAVSKPKRGGAAVAGPRGAAVRGPGGNVAVAGRGYGGGAAYHGGAYYGGRPYAGAGAVAAGVAFGAAAGAATTSAYYATTPYYNPYYPY